MSGRDALEPELCARAAAGDRQAFASLVHAHQSNLRNQLRRLTHGDAALADDLAQDSLVQAWMHMGAFKGDARFATWLYRIAYNSFLMHARRHGAGPTIAAQPGEAQQSDEVAASATPDHPMRLDVEAALQRLPEPERIALVHCYHLDLSHEEAAQVLNLPLGTLKSQVLRGKARLRNLLAAWAPENAT